METDSNLVLVNGYWLPESSIQSLGNDIYVEIGLLAASIGVNYQKGEHGYILSREEPALLGRIIAIDAAHGGADGGVRGPAGVQEKDVNLDVALRLAIMVELAGGKIILTRKADYSVSFAARLSTILDAKAECIISIHQSNAEGIRAYHGRDLNSRRLALEAHRELIQDLALKDQGLHESAVDLLHVSEVPGAIIETMSLFSPHLEKMASCVMKRQQAAAALYRGIRAFFEEL
ncbi:MAG: N-acetylmuramoyl-L-alanine amidase [Limnochordia bacterium]|jgi:N-acetylmuramoyl-L-alanine amidase|nr:N-acetylmuramoyl-L-alanine amidase [Limnochordia bacterium]MDD2630413.1 N-acetylmuramoyl-L-alanine amidase [Limnochordia bacterium]